VKTDNIFYELFQANPNVLFELIGAVPPTQTGLYTFISQEVKQTRFQIDGLLLPHHRRPDLPIYFIEVLGYKQKPGESFYHNFFSEINLYLNDYRPPNDWRGVLLFTEHRFDPGIPTHFTEYATSSRLQRLYLDRMPDEAEGRSLEVAAIQLIGLKPSQAAQWARALVERARTERTDATNLTEIIELISTICIYKFPDLTRQEIETMLGLSELRQTKVFQEAKEEGKQEVTEEERDRILALAVPGFLEFGLSVEQIADRLQTDVPTIQRIIQQQQQQN